MKEIILRMVATSLANQEHRALRDATDAASVSGETTYLCNSAGARVAAVVPLSRAEHVCEPAAGTVFGHDGNWATTADQAAGKVIYPLRGVCRICGEPITRGFDEDWRLI